jgi:hypothetical protein
MAERICPKCRYVGAARKRKRGSTQTEAMGWMMFPLGLPYTLWRMCTKIQECRLCGNKTLLKPNSADGLLFLAQEEAELRQTTSPAAPPIPVPSAEAAAWDTQPIEPRPKRTVDPDLW